MRRREFITFVGGAAVWPVVARAQQAPGRIARIVYLGMSSPSVLDPRQLKGLKQGLAENGLVEGTNIVLSLLWAEGDAARLSQLAAELGAMSTSS